VSVHPSTILATFFPNLRSISRKRFAPPQSSTESCRSAAIASVSFAPYSNTIAVTPRRCFFKLRRESHVLFSFCRGKQIVWQSSQPEIYLGAIPRPRAAAAPGRRKWRQIESSALADQDQHRAHGASAIDCSYWLGGVVRPRSMCCAISFRRLVIFRIVEVGNWRALISGRIQIFESEVRTRHNQ